MSYVPDLWWKVPLFHLPKHSKSGITRGYHLILHKDASYLFRYFHSSRGNECLIVHYFGYM